MGTSTPIINCNLSSFSKLLLLWTLSLLLPLTFIHLYLYPFPILLTPSDNDINLHSDIHILNISPPPSQEVDKFNASISCDYTNGKWVLDKNGPLYNGTTCGTIKDGQNCMTHGRPDKDYLSWKWSPKNCELRRFDPRFFLKLFKNKQLAFVGDSIARNQFESLLCMLATASPNPKLLYSNGEDNRFRKFHFGSHNFNLSIYWSPFLVKGIEKSGERYYNTLHLESVDEKWCGELSQYDTIVLSIGHWYLLPAVYYYKDSILGCHFCPDIKNCTEIGFYDVYSKAFKTALNAIIDKHQERSRKLDVIVTTFSPAHFEGDWDKFGACSRTKPYKPNEKKLEGMDAEMREYEMKSIEEAKRRANNNNNDHNSIRIEVVDVTKISLLRPDGHPGPYMNPFPFQNGVTERVQNDCVHWCMPGAIDTWNEILLEVLRKLNGLYIG